MSRSTEVVREARSGASYDAHSYHTKVPPLAIARLIRQHLPGGGSVGDAYCGSGTTGVAAALAESEAPGVAYDVVLGDLSPYATFIARALNSPPPVAEFQADARSLLRAARNAVSDYWTTSHSDGRKGEILYTIWSEILLCPACDVPLRYWEAAVDHERGAIRRELRCRCGCAFRKADARRQLERYFDPVLETSIERPAREPVVIAYEVDGRRYRKAPDPADFDRISALESAAEPSSCPRVRMLHREGAWGDLYRSGYHQGVTHVHHFYTRRNFLTTGHLWDLARERRFPEHQRFLISSYNLAHSTLMSRLVFKRGSSAPVLTGYQTGALYISSLPVEKNPLLGIERSKLRSITRAFELTQARRGRVKVLTAPATAWRAIREKLDYIFVDPPFGANIPYAEANFIAEAWLGEFTDAPAEAAISKFHGRTAADYRSVLAEGFDALRSRLRVGGVMTVMFHSSESEPWRAMTESLRDVGFKPESVQLLDKRQGSFKQVTSTIAVQGDVLIHVRNSSRRNARDRLGARDAAQPLEAVSWLTDRLGPLTRPLSLQEERELFSSYAAACVAASRQVELSAEDFYRVIKTLQRSAAGSIAA